MEKSITIKKRIKILFSNISKKSSAFKKFYRTIRYVKNRIRYFRFWFKPVDEELVVFEAFMGRKYADSPKAIYEFMKNNDGYNAYKFVWFFRGSFIETFRDELTDHDTKVVQYGSNEYYKYYATAKYWITNSRIPDPISRKKNQIYVQCWHGTPLKRLGFDIEVKGDNALNSMKELRKKYEIDAKKYSYMVSPSAFCSEKFRSAFNLKAVGREDIIIEQGYPRNDFLKNFTPKDVAGIKEALNLPADKKVILYAPTWRDNQHQSGLGYTYKNEVDFDRLRDALGDEYIILFRAHYFVANQFNFDAYEGFVYNVSDYSEINDLYIIADRLITDYSSVFFDYAILKRPISFYMYDLEEYRDDIRGFYISLDELPGNIVQTEEELINDIKNDEGYYDEVYRNFNDTYNYLDDGKASERVVGYIFS